MKILTGSSDSKLYFPTKIVAISELRPPSYNPVQLWMKEKLDEATEAVRFSEDIVPIIINGAENRKNVIIGNQIRLQVAKNLGREHVTAICVNLSDVEEEKRLNVELRKYTGHVDGLDSIALMKFGRKIFKNIGFSDERISALLETTK